MSIATTPSDPLKRAAWLGVGLMGVTLFLISLLAGGLFWINRGTTGFQLPLALGVLSGFVLLIVVIAGLVLIYNALGIADANSALGLPSGSIRALLALALVAVFIGVCSAELVDIPTANSDAAKQILSIAATALTTIVGFYFGSNSASEAFNAANQAANADNSVAPPTLDDLTSQAASIKTLADGLQQKLDAARDPDPDKLDAQKADAPSVAALRDKLAAASAQVTAAGVDRDRAAQLVAAANSDAGKLAASGTAMQQYTADAAGTKATFAAALLAYTTARDALLATMAKG